jgi:hypothetical protein
MRLRAAKLEPAVRAATVVVLDIVPKDCLQVARPDDQHPIEAFGLDRLHPSLCEGVGAGCLDRGANDVDAACSEDHIEAVGAENPIMLTQPAPARTRGSVHRGRRA